MFAVLCAALRNPLYSWAVRFFVKEETAEVAEGLAEVRRRTLMLLTCSGSPFKVSLVKCLPGSALTDQHHLIARAGLFFLKSFSNHS